VTVTVNGEAHEFAAGASVAKVVATLASPTGGVAVAVNDAVVPRSAWESTTLQDGDRVEVLTAVQGG
jgi:sulfur carrier protein